MKMQPTDIGESGFVGGEREPSPEAVRVRLLGTFRVSVGSRTVRQRDWRLRKAAALVKLLALAPRHTLHREVVTELLWPGLGADAAANNLHRTLHAARRALDPHDSSRYLRLKDEQLQLCPDGQLWVDAEVFEEAAARARRSREPAAYRAAVELYAGELLPGDRYEEWAQDRGEGLRQIYLSLLLEMAGAHEKREDFEPAIQALEKAVAEEPADEEAHVGLVRLYALSGRRDEALRRYERLCEDLRREFGREPGAGRRLYEEILAGRFPPVSPPDERSAVDTDGVRRHNLPAPRTSFVERERELVEVKRELAMSRLLTLTGAGGCGKTRLALEVARDLLEIYPDGVWLIELAPLTDPALVPNAVAGALGVPEQPARPLGDSLRSRRMLLVLDNCEHVIHACARLVDTLLSSCEHMRVLATSREALGVDGEVTWLVRPLSLPDAQRSPTVEELPGYEAVGLFVDRARSRLPGFELTRENAPAVAKICREVDGIPLAIELATARMGVLAVEQVAERLEDSLKLLTMGSRTVEPRQRTLRATLEWSYGLLSEPERALFERLSVFAGGWTLEAAEAVGAGSGIEEDEVLDLLSRLVDKSLVVVEAVETLHATSLRYRLLETVRQYASGKLGSGGEEEAVRQRHALYFLELAERAEPELSGAGQAAWLDRLERELDNLRAAVGYFRESGQRPAHLRLAGSLWRFCYLHGHYGEGREWLEWALARGDDAPPSARAKAHLGDGVLTFLQCEYDRARGRLEEALALYRALGDDRGVASASQMLGSIARERGDYARSEALHEESLALWRKLGDEAGEARSLNYLGSVAWLQEKHERAKELCEGTLVRFRRLGDNEGIAWALISLGSSALYAGDRRRARVLLEESLALCREVGYKEGVAWSLNQLGVLARHESDHRRATDLLRESLEIHQNLGDRWRTASVLEAMAEAHCATGHLEPAARLFGAAEAVRDSIRAPVPLCERADREESISATRAGMGEEAFEAAFSEGQAMSPEQAIEYALSPEEAVSPTASVPVEPSSVLTRREQEIAALLARGLTNRQISEALSISERTVTTHVDHILTKLGAASRAQVAAWVVERRTL